MVKLKFEVCDLTPAFSSENARDRPACKIVQILETETIWIENSEPSRVLIARCDTASDRGPRQIDIDRNQSIRPSVPHVSKFASTLDLLIRSPCRGTPQIGAGNPSTENDQEDLIC